MSRVMEVEEGRRLALVMDRIVKGIAVSEDGCWEWQRHIDKSGYGIIWAGAWMSRVHQVAYRIVKGDVPEGLEIDHLCRNRRCCNPHHLEAVTHAENMRRSTVVASAAAANKDRFRRQTHCKRGHEFSVQNTRIYVTRGYQTRHCRACKAELNRGYRKVARDSVA
jgi:hypothetical protein